MSILLIDMFSPILAILAVSASPAVAPSKGIALNSSMSVLTAVRARSASPSTKPMNSSFFATKSVSELTSTIAAFFPSSETAVLTRPMAAILPAFFAAFDRPFSLRISTAFSRSASASTRAFLQSIMPAPVISRSSFTSFAVTSAMITCPPLLLQPLRPLQPLQELLQEPPGSSRPAWPQRSRLPCSS